MRNVRDNKYTVITKAISAIMLFGIIIELIVGGILLNVTLGGSLSKIIFRLMAGKAITCMVNILTLFIVIFPVAIIIMIVIGIKIAKND